MNSHARRPAAALAALGLAATFALAAHAPEGCSVALEGDPATEDDDVFACEQQQWFHTAATPANNIGHVDASDTHGRATFDANPPAGSVTGGNGGGYLGWSTLLVGFDDDVTDAVFTGQFTGTIDSMDFDVHLLVDSITTLDSLPGLVYEGDYPIDLDVTIDGVAVHSTADEPLRVHFGPEENSNAGAYRLDFALTDIAELFDRFDLANGEDTEHEIEVRIGSAFLDEVWIMAFDTTEVPGGITFNPVVLPERSTVVSVS